MKKIVSLLTTVLLLFLVACEKQAEDTPASPPQEEQQAADAPASPPQEQQEVIESDFKMTVDSVFTISGRGEALGGVIESGQISVDDYVDILDNAGNLIVNARVASIESETKIVDSASAGATVGLLIADVERDSIDNAHTLVMGTSGEQEEAADDDSTGSYETVINEVMARENVNAFPAIAHALSAEDEGYRLLLDPYDMPVEPAGNFQNSDDEDKVQFILSEEQADELIIFVLDHETGELKQLSLEEFFPSAAAYLVNTYYYYTVDDELVMMVPYSSFHDDIA